MQKLFDEVGSLDKRCYEKFTLSEELLMENAAIALLNEINSHESLRRILIVSGVGNNGADGITLARMLFGSCDVTLCIPFELKSPMAKLQLQRAKLLGIKETKTFFHETYDIVVDALFGSGLNKQLSNESTHIINSMNKLNAYKIACDIPSGIDIKGNPNPIAFKADVTITMGALKTSLYSDDAKDHVGNIKVANLGITRKMYEQESTMFVLQKSDMRLPIRKINNTNKGDFGHCAIILGDKVGAAVMSSLSAFVFGAGLVSVVSEKNIDLPHHIMQSHQIPKNTTALALGMGLGGQLSDEHLCDISKLKIPKVIDADIFYKNIVLEFLKSEDIVLTPHPKEFASLLSITQIGRYSVEDVQSNRLDLARTFCAKYPKVTLVLKGANSIIAHESLVFINPFGKPNLSKGGSGDILCGLIASLLAQSYKPLDAAISASLALALASENFQENSYALTPQKLIDEIAQL